MWDSDDLSIETRIAALIASGIKDRQRLIDTCPYPLSSAIGRKWVHEVQVQCPNLSRHRDHDNQQKLFDDD